jgi:hypothetical protein
MRVFLTGGNGKNIDMITSDSLCDGFKVCSRSYNVELVFSLALALFIHKKDSKNQAG